MQYGGISLLILTLMILSSRDYNFLCVLILYENYIKGNALHQRVTKYSPKRDLDQKFSAKL
ncbi:hypothetical protein X471_00089 [Bartonella bacilliformis str. Heidi Mejia]|nr:hypothetical protein X472_00092 [Bartonella bacilliformis San Pedro600-02]EYS92599.1 hypothetical protein X471_00089 [Bartonella bacilliformis str. Heidi Mejia]EYS94684.1 hypothetical protein X470_00976 [Bartonella bacilliformis Peru-18]KEG16285.1 hypothetical protein H709_00870 [Bartonella bacilliformis CUSCO5]KEG19110.1 hypothetical protein H707_00856 [Bartonella bacilliformis Hosp800-02]KEG20233.1 hypothetical protein H704_00881 [Bartonella bacilliformis Peru38]KEG22311.1 hypothetical p